MFCVPAGLPLSLGYCKCESEPEWNLPLLMLPDSLSLA